MADIMTLPHLAKNPYSWIIAFLLAIIAWIPTVLQAHSMFPLQMYGTMGMTLAPFLLFWTIMMAAMMLPALAPSLSFQYMSIDRQTSNVTVRMARMSIFILGYLCMWSLFGIPAFFLALLGAQFLRHAPIAGVGYGILIFLFAGAYQLTPLKQFCLAHCNPSLNCYAACHAALPVGGWLSDAKGGLSHGLYCLGCCGNLMLVLLAVGFMNLFWMFLMTLVIFLEKVWSRGPRLSLYLGAALLFYALLAFIDPGLLPGLYAGHF